MDDVAAHLFEYRVQGVEQRLGGADHKGQGARLRAAGTAGHRRIGHLHALLGGCSGDIAGGLRVDGAAIHRRHAFGNTGEHTVLTQPHAAHMSRSREHGNHHFRALGSFAWRSADMATQGSQFSKDILVQVKQVQRVPGLEQIARHRCAHVAQADKCDVHTGALNEGGWWC